MNVNKHISKSEDGQYSWLQLNRYVLQFCFSWSPEGSFLVLRDLIVNAKLGIKMNMEK